MRKVWARVHAVSVCCVLSAVCCLLASAEEPHPGEPVGGLQVELAAEQQPFRLGEPMPIRATLRNVGDVPLWLWPWCKPLQPPRIAVRLGESATLDLGAAFAEQERRWVLWDATGGRIDSSYAPEPCDFSDEDIIALAPGESWSSVEELSTYYPIRHAGAYVLRARYEPGVGAPPQVPEVWSGVAVAAPLSINVTSE